MGKRAAGHDGFIPAHRAMRKNRRFCLMLNTADRPMLIRGCDITQDQVRVLKLRFKSSDLRPSTIMPRIR